VVLALIAERVGGPPFADLVRERVCRPAGLTDTEFLRSDEPAGRTALGYLEPAGSRTNVLHLPVRGSGVGGIHSTAADVHLLWEALLAGRIVPVDQVAEMVRPHSEVPGGSRCATGSGAGCIPPATPSSWKAPTPGCPSAASMTRSALHAHGAVEHQRRSVTLRPPPARRPRPLRSAGTACTSAASRRPDAVPQRSLPRRQAVLPPTGGLATTGYSPV
jgi:beta-lactamase family protein